MLKIKTGTSLKRCQRELNNLTVPHATTYQKPSIDTTETTPLAASD